MDVSMFDESFVSKSIQKRVLASNCHSLESYMDILNTSETEENKLLKSMQVSYSEFFRNSLTFAVLEKITLPELIQWSIKNNRSQLRIWSVACASGQEAYSLAMLLEEHLENETQKIQYQIFATDQSESAIEQSKLGLFANAEVQNLSQWRLNRWFIQENEDYRIKDVLRNNIHFSVFDMLSSNVPFPPESIYGAFNLIFCANILFYYKPEFQDVIVKNATKALVNNGFIVTGEVERPILKRNAFKEVYPFAAIFKRL